MEKINYTIRYVYAGINQYADFTVIDGKVVNSSFHPQYCKIGEIPSLKGIDSIEEIVEVIKGFSFHGRAEIYLINGVLPELYYNSKLSNEISETGEKINLFTSELCYSFFMNHIKPILIKNDWFISRSSFNYPILINKDKSGEWQNIAKARDSELIEFICYKFLNEINLYDDDVDLRPESNSTILNGFSKLMCILTNNQINSIGLYIEL